MWSYCLNTRTISIISKNMEEVFTYYSENDDKIFYKKFIEELLFKDSSSNMENKSIINDNHDK